MSTLLFDHSTAPSSITLVVSSQLSSTEMIMARKSISGKAFRGPTFLANRCLPSKAAVNGPRVLEKTDAGEYFRL